ncbi:MAG TPA: sugar transferase [Candidatus Dormibacteraeota bacterium]|nr:sugar transferase [Candidatus Dormibacteraeota bacterium]
MLLGADLAGVTLGLALAYVARYGSLAPGRDGMPLVYLAPLWALWLVALAVLGLHQRRNTVSGIGEYRRILTAGAVVLLAVIVVSYAGTQSLVSRGFLALAFVAVSLLVGLGRFATRRWIYAQARRGRCLDRAVVIGTNRQAVAVARQLEESAPASCQVVGFLTDYGAIGHRVQNGLTVLGEPMQLETLGPELGLTKAIVVQSGISWESLQWLVAWMQRSTGVEFCLVPGLHDLHSTPMSTYQLGGLLTLVPHSARVVGVDAVLKRGLELVVTLPACVVALPAIAVLAVCSRLAGRGWGIAAEEFVDGRGTYRLWRFSDSEFARRYHLARLPSLPLVLSGRVGLLGPRPIPRAQPQHYAKARLFLDSARPGFIGPWWLVGIQRPADLDAELAFDLYYLRHYSIWLDVHILVQAARGVLGRRVSAGPPLRRLPARAHSDA